MKRKSRPRASARSGSSTSSSARSGVAQVLDDLIDGRDQQVFLRDEVVVDEARGQAGFGGDALHRGLGDAVLQDGGAQTFDDLTAAWSGETRASHR